MDQLPDGKPDWTMTMHAGFFVSVCGLMVVVGITMGMKIKDRMWRPILIEHGAAYYTHDTGEFVIIRKDKEDASE